MTIVMEDGCAWGEVLDKKEALFFVYVEYVGVAEGCDCFFFFLVLATTTNNALVPNRTKGRADQGEDDRGQEAQKSGERVVHD